jgi:sec-independent protein translocase protein TatB
MFDIGWSELLLIGMVALIAIGPKELPGALRALGQWMAKIRRMAAEFQGQFQEAMREAEVDQLRKDMDEMAAKAKDYTQFDPIEDVRKDIERSIGDLPAADQPPAPAPEVATAPPAPDTPAVAMPTPSADPVADRPAAEPVDTRPAWERFMDSSSPQSVAAPVAPQPVSPVPTPAEPDSRAPAASEPASVEGKPDTKRAPA